MVFRISAQMEPYRIRRGEYASDPGDPFGAFERMGRHGAMLVILASDGKTDEVDADMRNWEHVSVSTKHRVPNWSEMCWVKDLFWDLEDAVVQFHPPHSQYINCHPTVLHLWRHRHIPFPLPPGILVGPLSQ